MSTLDINLTHSRDACTYVLNTLTLGGANWDQYQDPKNSWEDCVNSNKGKKYCDALKDPVDICLYDKVRPGYKTKIVKAKTMLEKLRIIANKVKQEKCGNCGEFSALAFMYLYDKGVRPIDWMSLVGGDHAFVVIGRESKSNANDVLTWGR